MESLFSGVGTCTKSRLRLYIFLNNGLPLFKATKGTDLIMPVKFTQSCPTCGRRTDIRASLLGCTVACQHCGAEFIATATDDPVADASADAALLDRVERALQKAKAAAEPISPIGSPDPIENRQQPVPLTSVTR